VYNRSLLPWVSFVCIIGLFCRCFDMTLEHEYRCCVCVCARARSVCVRSCMCVTHVRAHVDVCARTCIADTTHAQQTNNNKNKYVIRACNVTVIAGPFDVIVYCRDCRVSRPCRASFSHTQEAQHGL